MNGIQEVLMSRSWTSVVDFGDDITGMPEEFVVIILSGLKSIAMLEEGGSNSCTNIARSEAMSKKYVPNYGSPVTWSSHLNEQPHDLESRDAPPHPTVLKVHTDVKDEF